MRIFLSPKFCNCVRNSPQPVPIPRKINAAHVNPNSWWRSVLILFSNLRLGLPGGIFPSGLPKKKVVCVYPENSKLGVLGFCDRASWDVGWREINQQDVTNPMFIIKLLSQHVSGIVMPIIRRTRPCITACGVLHWLCWLWLCGAGS